MPIFKLRKHQSNSCDEDILINQADFPELKLRDIIEVRSPKAPDPSKRLFLQIRKWADWTSSNANTVSIKESVANHLKLYSDVVVEKVGSKDDVLVDSIEICFSNAYLARSYMWGLRSFLNYRCVYQNHKLNYLNIRSQICEIWSQGIKVHSGFIDDDTKIVFRSASSLVYLFIQMSSEMWDYDINGDLYCEKAINGFLTDLFDAWRKNDCSHDITIILFSRTFFEAKSLDEFPQEMGDCLQVDSKGRFYEDYYRVAFQNDRFDLHDWNSNLTKLKLLFNQYQKEVIDRHQNKYDMTIPRAYNSNASQGNFLEVLNMSLNVFEKHYFDRSFDRTGQLSVVVSPGVGVFEVDFEMTNLTKQRIIDNGIGSDLVCLGEQPLHTVPLLKLNSKYNPSDTDSGSLGRCDVYNMPHWINLSFYSSTNQTYLSNFIPRIKLPTLLQSRNSVDSTYSTASSSTSAITTKTNDSIGGVNEGNHRDSNDVKAEIDTCIDTLEKFKKERYSTSRKPQLSTASAPTIPDLVDYDEYDLQVFKPSPFINFQNQAITTRRAFHIGNNIQSDRKENVNASSRQNANATEQEVNKSKDDGSAFNSGTDKDYDEGERESSEQAAIRTTSRRKQVSENLPLTQLSSSTNRARSDFPFPQMSLNNFIERTPKPESADDLLVRGYNLSSSRLNKSHSRPKALINPFDPSHMTIKLTPNRRRWTHVFPQGPSGTFIQQHHYQPMQSSQKSSSSAPYLANVAFNPIRELEESAICGNRNSKCGNQSILSSRISNLRSSVSSARNQRLISPKPVTHAADGYSNLTSSTHGNKSAVVSNDTIRFAWCASGEQEWNPAITTGVDWKSLTMPACLPLTTDFFPSKTSLQNDYVIAEYTIDSSCIHPRYSLLEVYRELVCQRLQKGFQIILLPRQTRSSDQTPTSPSSTDRQQTSANTSPLAQTLSTPSLSPSSPATSSSAASTATQKRKSVRDQQQQSLMAALSNSNSRKQSSNASSLSQTEVVFVEKERTDYTLSIGRIFHRLTLNSCTISVTIYKPRHPYPIFKIIYWYRFRAPFHETYEKSVVHFKSEKLEDYNWSYLDNYICVRGEAFKLRTSLNFWRFRVLVLPSQLSLRVLKHEDDDIDENQTPKDDDKTRYDIHYLDYNSEERNSLLDSFVKLLEIINKTRRASSTARSSTSSMSSQKGCLNPNHHPAQHKMATSSTTTASSISADDPNRLDVIINDSIGGCEQPLELRAINMDIDSTLRDAKRAEWVHVQHHSHYEPNQAFELVIKWMVASGVGIAEMVQGWSRRAGNSSVHLVPIPWEPFAMPNSGKADPLRCPLFIQLRVDELVIKFPDHKLLNFQDRILRRFGFIRFHDLISEISGPQYVHLTGFAFVGLVSNASSNDTNNVAVMMSDNNSPSKSSVDTSANSLVCLTTIADDEAQRNNDLRCTSPSKLSPRSRPPLSKSPSFESDTNGWSVGLSRLVRPQLKSQKTLEHQDTVSSPHEEYITRHISGDRSSRGITSASKCPSSDASRVDFIWSWNYMLTKRWRSASTLDESAAVSLMQDFKRFCQNDRNRLVNFYTEVQSNL